MGNVVDQGMKDQIRRRVIFPLDDVQVFLDYSARPSSAHHESMWLDHAETRLRGAEDEFRELRTTIEKYGGPEKVSAIG